MKKMILVGLVFAGVTAFGQKIDASKVPTAAQSAFSKNFPGVKDVKWEKEKGNYEANFKQNGQKMSALFDANGAWLETETDIAINTLPIAVTDYVAKNYKGEKIKEAAKLKMANGDNNYEAEVKGMDLIFDANGKFIKSVKD
jgi:hypothetical protein